MSEELVAPEAFRDRTGWIVAFGIFQAALALLILASVVLVLFIPMPPSTGSVSRLSGVALPAACGTALLVAAIGSILRKNWGRIASLVLSSLWLFSGLCGLAFMAALFPGMPEEQRRQMLGFVVGFLACGFVLPPALFLLFYSRKSVRATFLANSPPRQGPRRPLSIVLLSGWLALVVFASLSGLLLSRPAAIFFGVVLHGPLAVVVMATNAAIFAGMAWGIWRQRVAAWWTALFFSVFWSVSGVVFFSRLDWWSMTRELGYSQPELESPYFDVAAFSRFLRVSVVLGGVLFVGLVVYTRRHFQPPISSPGRSVS